MDVLKTVMNLLNLIVCIALDRGEWEKNNLCSQPQLIGTRGVVLVGLPTSKKEA